MDRITIRNLDKELIRQARLAALKEQITLGEFVNQAIREKLADEKKEAR